MVLPTLTRLQRGDLERLLRDSPELSGALPAGFAHDPWVAAAELRWGCCGVAARDGEEVVAVVLAGPRSHAPDWHPIAALQGAPGEAMLLVSWAAHDDVRLGRLATTGLVAGLAQSGTGRLEALSGDWPASPSALLPSPRWLVGCGFTRRRDRYVLDVSATARWRARALVRWLAAVPLRMPAPRPAPEGSTGRAAGRARAS